MIISSCIVKGIVSDSDNIFLGHEWEDIKKGVISKISVDANLKFYKLRMIRCIDIAPQTTVLNLVSSTRLYVKKNVSHWNEFCLIPLRKCAFWRRATNGSKKLKFWNFWECPLYEIWGYALNLKKIIMNSFLCRCKIKCTIGTIVQEFVNAVRLYTTNSLSYSVEC